MPMESISEMKYCCGCNICTNICNSNSVVTIPNQGFGYPHINVSSCVRCGLCKGTCPVNSSQSMPSFEQVVVGGIAKDATIVQDSSSGGVFRGICESIIRDGGVVIGPCFDEHFVLKHTVVEELNEIKKMQGSKYVQSQKGMIFRDIKKILETNRKVLFSGTPCEIQGLVHYLGKEYSNLYTQDVLCHGVASPQLWLKYLEWIEKKYNSEIADVSFRDKKYGWKDYRMLITLKNGKKYSRHHNFDPYMRLFLLNYSVRESCINCRYRSMQNRTADITLGDFWNLDDYEKNEKYKNGVTCVVINSSKGETLFNQIKKNYITIPINKNKQNEILNQNAGGLRFSEDRNSFLCNIADKDFNSLVHEYLKDGLVFRIRSLIKCTTNGLV